MIRYIVVVHYHYDSTEPVGGSGGVIYSAENEPVPSYATKAEAEELARQQDSGMATGYVWAVEF